MTTEVPEIPACLFKKHHLQSACAGKIGVETCILWRPRGKVMYRNSFVCKKHRLKFHSLVFEGINEGKTLRGYGRDAEP